MVPGWIESRLMSNKSGRTPPEAELEALLTPALNTAFPHIPSNKFHHQTFLKGRIGHSEYEVDGLRSWEFEGKADIILFYEEQPLAVVEVKREDKKLTEKDRRQGMSYAEAMTPRPPLVILTNGQTTDLYDSASGEKWSPSSPDGIAINKLFENAAKIASANLDWTIEVLMGPEAGVWTNVVRARTNELIAQLSGSAVDAHKPFVRDLLFPRKATSYVEEKLDVGTQIILLHGAPLIGKTHIFKDLAGRFSTSDEFAFFLVRSGGAQGYGLFQHIANVFSGSLEWAVTPNDVRQWLRRMSSFTHGPALVLGIDSLFAGSAIADDLEELAAAGFGKRLRILATVDDPTRIRINQNGRGETAIGQISELVEIAPLDIDEFRAAEGELEKHRIRFTKGSDVASEYRIPWILRAISADVLSDPMHQDHDAIMPSLLGINLIHKSRSKLSTFADAQRGYRLLARDAVADNAQISPELALEAAHAFVVRRDALSSPTREMVPQLIEQGWLSSYRHAGDDDIVVPCSPEFFLSEFAAASSEELERRVDENEDEAAIWLANRFEGVFLGDLIGAQAILDMARRRGGYSSRLFLKLLEQRPSVTKNIKGLFALPRPDGSIQNFLITEDRKMFCTDANGRPIGEGVDVSDDMPSTYVNLAGWMILAQLARVPAIADADGSPRVDLTMLLEIGTCPIPLLQGARDPIGHLVHDIEGHGEILCHENGVVEAATAAMEQTFSNDWQGLDGWFDEAISRRSLPLLTRISIALREIYAHSAPQKAQWSQQMLENKVEPAISELIREVSS